jgi:hypothetical protein
MTMNQDSRLLVRFASAADSPPDAATALLIEDGHPAAVPPPTAVAVARFAVPVTTAHAFGCACCLPRGPVAVALGRLFLARARGEAPLFDTVVAVTSSAAGQAAVRAALEQDVVTRARFRLAPDRAPT